MGHREDLLIGAKRCLLEIGYGRTTSRDIVAASGANLASIGYHYGSKDALLNAGLLSALSDFGEEIRQAIAISASLDADPIERFEAAWEQMVKIYSTHRQLLLASVEAFAQVDRVPVLHNAVADGFQQGRESMVELFRAIVGDSQQISPEADKTIGSFFQALATGVMSQWLVDPDRAPSAHDLVTAVKAITSGLSATTADHSAAVV